MRVSRNDLPDINAMMERKEPQEILAWGWETFGSSLTMATAFGAEGCALVAMLSEISRDASIFNLDTGYQFEETLRTRDRLMEKYGVRIELVRPRLSVAEMEAEYGGPIYGTNPNQCCHIRKVIPLREMLVGHEAWITAIRREQSPSRAHAPVVGWDEKFELVKINPLARWTRTQLWSYLLDNDVPYNPMHDQGFPSIGCWPCTRAIGAGEDERSGRWAGTAKKECGLHVINSGGDGI